MLKLRHVKKHFDTPHGKLKAVDGISLELSENKILGVVGESGSGKSTLGKLIVGLHDKTEGSVEFNTKRMPKRFCARDFMQFSQDIQMIFQDPYSALNPRMQLWQLLEEPCLLAKDKNYLSLNKEQRLAFLKEWLNKVGLRADYYDRYAHEFSGGQQQRIGIARALIQKPKLLICDEPISALDVSVQAQIVNLIKSLQVDLNMSVLFIAHDLAMVNYLCDQVVVMYLGKIVEQGDTQSVFKNPQHPYTQLLLASNPSINHEGLTMNATLASEELGSDIEAPNGCSFVSRCSRHTKQCALEEPKLLAIEPDDSRKVACFNI